MDQKLRAMYVSLRGRGESGLRIGYSRRQSSLIGYDDLIVMRGRTGIRIG
jgi:hypothetical protein